MMAYYRFTISRGGNDTRMITVSWDDYDPNRVIGYPMMTNVSVLTQPKLVEMLYANGFGLTSVYSENIKRGWGVCQRVNSIRRTYNPLNNQWQVWLSGEEKQAIANLYPDAKVPGVPLKFYPRNAHRVGNVVTEQRPAGCPF